MKSILTALGLLIASSACAAPQLIAHRGGTGDAPENTFPAIKLALENKAEAIWITVQLSHDGVPVLYRPSDLSALTDHTGKVSSFSAAELARMDAGWKWGGETHPWRGKNATIPTLQSVLEQWPQTFFYIDIKSPDADTAMMASRLSEVLQTTHSLSRVRVYSTETAISRRYRNLFPISSAGAKRERSWLIFPLATRASQPRSRAMTSGTGLS